MDGLLAYSLILKLILILILTHGRRVDREAGDLARVRGERGLRRRRRVFGKGNSLTECQLDTGRETGKDLRRQEGGGEGR